MSTTVQTLPLISMQPSATVEEASEVVAADLMASPAVACRANAFFEEIAESLADANISGMPVVDDRGKLVGVISERDLAHALGGPLVRLAIRRHAASPSWESLSEIPRESRRVKDIMSTHLVSARPETTVRELAVLVVTHDIGRVPIVADGRLVGLVSRGDLLAHLAGIAANSRHVHVSSVVVGTGDGPVRPSFDWGRDGHRERSIWTSRRHVTTTQFSRRNLTRKDH